jgi:hypothetical protein
MPTGSPGGSCSQEHLHSCVHEVGATHHVSSTSAEYSAVVYIVSALNGFVLDIAGANAAPGTPVIVWPRDPRSSAANVTNRQQHWNLPRGARGYVSSLLNGFVLDIAGGSRAAGAAVVAWPRNTPATANQLWTVERQPGGRCYIVSALNGFVLDIAGADPARGAPVIAWPRNTPATANQLWTIEQMID